MNAGALADGAWTGLWTPALAIGGVVLFIVLAVALASGLLQQRRRVERRLAMVRARSGGAGVALPSIRRQDDESSFEALDRIMRRVLPQTQMLRLRLTRAGVAAGPGAYAAACLMTGVIAGAVVQLLAGMPPIVTVLAALVGGVGLPHMVLSLRIARRRARFVALFPSAIDVMVRGLKSGLPIAETIAIVAKEFAQPLKEEFQRVIDATRLGKTLEEGLWEAALRVNAQEFKFFIVALSVQRETGGNLAETLENLGDVLRKRQQMRAKVKALSAEPKASATILGSMPFIMFALIGLMNGDYVSTLLSDPRGHVIIGFGLLSELVGILVMAKMIRFEI